LQKHAIEYLGKGFVPYSQKNESLNDVSSPKKG
jgi:hypothetical protein